MSARGSFIFGGHEQSRSTARVDERDRARAQARARPKEHEPNEEAAAGSALFG